jgi:hypothetical protein
MRPRLALAAALLLGVGLTTPALAALSTDTDGASYESTAKVVVPMVFPVAGPAALTTYTDTFLACRSGCSRHHMGQDLMGPKLSPLVAAFDGVVSSLKRESAPGGGNYVVITADSGPAAGWSALYVHVNNDTPGTDDGKGTAAWSFPAGIARGAHVVAGQLIAWRGDSGDAENTGPHCHFELRKGDGWGGIAYNAFPSLKAARHLAAPTASGPHPDGTLMRNAAGGLVVVGAGSQRPISPAVAAANGRSETSAVALPAAESRGYAVGAPVLLRDGTVARDGAGALWLVTAGQRVAATSAQLAVLGHPDPRVWPVGDGDLAALPVTDALPSSPYYPGALVRTDGTAEARYVDVDGTLLSVDAVALASHGWTTQDVAVLPADAVTSASASASGQVQRSASQTEGALDLRDGVLVQTPSHLVGVVSGGAFRRIWDSREVAAYGYIGKPRLLVPTALITALPAAELTAR